MIIGLDVGTTAVKAVAFGLTARDPVVAVREHPVLEPEPGWHVHDPHLLTAAVVDALAECAERIGSAACVGVAVSAAAHGLVGMDDQRRPLTPIVTWADTRAQEQARRLVDAGTGSLLHERSGTPVHPMTPLTKLMWFAEHDPRLLTRVRWWGGIKEHVLATLTGTVVTELSSASTTGLLSIHNRQWDPETVLMSGAALDQMPPIVSPTAVLPLARDVAPRIGLPAGLPVVAGAADGPLATIGAGALGVGSVGISIGTSAAARMLVDAPTPDVAGRLFCYALTEHQWVLGGALSNGGVALRWAGGVFGGQPTDAGVDDAATLSLAESAPPGSDGLAMLPFVLPERAPLSDLGLTGAYLGVRSQHTRGHFLRATVEGVASQLGIIVDVLAESRPVTDVRATGGALRSRLWRSVLAGVLDRPVTVTGVEGAALGAATLGLVALGRADDLAQARAQLRYDDETTEQPDPAAVAAYRRLRASLPALLDSCTKAAAPLARHGEPRGDTAT